MGGDDRIEIEQRLNTVDDQRGTASQQDFVKKLATDQQFSTALQNATVRIDGTEYRPFLFTKGMRLDRPNDETADQSTDPQPPRDAGIVDPDRKLTQYLDAVRTKTDPSRPKIFEQGGDRLFIGVPGVHSVSLSGMEAWRGVMPPAPDPTAPTTAAEMVDLYAMEQLRDVPFVDWANEPGPDGSAATSETFDAVQSALAKDLDTIDSEVDPDWWYGPERLFVEADWPAREAWGPFVSQFLLHDVELWALPVKQRYQRYKKGVDYNASHEQWLRTLEGRGPEDGSGSVISAEVNPKTPQPNSRGYIETPRHLATIVNAEPPYQEYLIAALFLLSRDWVTYDDGLIYVTRDDGPVFNYTDNGPVGLVDLVARAGREALLAAFYHKYYLHFRCRPETYAGRIYAQEVLDDVRDDFKIDPLITTAQIAERQREQRMNGDGDPWLLSTAYAEGSPVHPAYPSGHSVIAGACGTVLKAWFANTDWDDDEPYYLPVDGEGDRLTTDVPTGHMGLHQEIDKLISNIGLARMFAGVHYYTDHYHAVKLGEQVAVGLLSDVWGRAFEGREEIAPTFTPYLDYDKDAKLSIDGSPQPLKQLRQAAAKRDPGPPQ